MKKLTPEQVVELNKKATQAILKDKTLRFGQALYNELHMLDFELAKSISDTDSDPFYDNKNIDNFFIAITAE